MSDVPERELFENFLIAFTRELERELTYHQLGRLLGYRVVRAMQNALIPRFRPFTLLNFEEKVRDLLTGRNKNLALKSLIEYKATRNLLPVEDKYYKALKRLINHLREIFTKFHEESSLISFYRLGTELGVELWRNLYRNSRLDEDSFNTITNNIDDRLTGRYREIAIRSVENLRVYIDRLESKDYILRDFLNYEDWENLLDFSSYFWEYMRETTNIGRRLYPNRGARINMSFKRWVVNKFFPQRHFLRKKIEKIEDRESNEILNFIIYRVRLPDLSLREISRQLNEIGLLFSHHQVGNIALEYVFNNDNNLFRQRFPSRISQEIRDEIRLTAIEESEKPIPISIRKIAERFNLQYHEPVRGIIMDTVPKEIYYRKWIANKNKIPQNIKIAIREEVKKHYPLSLREIQKEHKVSLRTVVRIAKKENSKPEYRRKWPYHKITDDIRNDVIEEVSPSRSLTQMAIAIKHGITPHSVRRIAWEYIYKDDEEAYRKRFPQDIFFILGLYTHKCITDLLTEFFEDYYEELYFAEPQIFPYSSIRPDGLILNSSDFLQQRLTDPNNKRDISQLIFNIPSELLFDQLDHIVAILIDFTSDLTKDNILEKIEKYQAKNMILFIVGTEWVFPDDIVSVTESEDVKYSNNIKIISADLFIELIGLRDEALKKFNDIIDFKSKNDIESLKSIREISSRIWNFQNKLRQVLEEKDLIEKHINEYFKIPIERKTTQKTLFFITKNYF